MGECGGTWDFPIQVKVGRRNEQDKKMFKSCALCPCQGLSAHYLPEVHSNKNFLFVFRAATGNTASYAVDCCGYRQESWQRKHTSIKYCNAELVDYTKAAKFSCAASPFIHFFPACYHNYTIENFLWNILLNTIDSIHSLS